ncbi:MAG: MBL fold metallo-hydrolase [Lachnospiraceae bacterium]|nr:MBL fold metallo-hydrolase [Lachnospiraceae bacterium]
MKVVELRYSNTNTWLIRSGEGSILFDTGWAGTFQAFLAAMGEQKLAVQDIDLILISHFHPDHCGIAQEIAALGPKIVVADVQRDYIHFPDRIFAAEKKFRHVPIEDEGIVLLPLAESREFLKRHGFAGQLLHTPGHSDDSISLCLDGGSIFVGDLNPLYELEAHKGTQIEESWKKLLALKPHSIYYGHAATAHPGKNTAVPERDADLDRLVESIMRLIDKGSPLDRIARKTGAERAFVENVARMYLTHRDIGVQGILDRIELRGIHAKDA